MQSFPRFPRNDGKGKYRITVPEAQGFEKRAKTQKKTIRELKNDADQKQREREEEYEIACQFRAQNIPKSTLENRYERILEEDRQRQVDNKQKSVAMT